MVEFIIGLVGDFIDGVVEREQDVLAKRHPWRGLGMFLEKIEIGVGVELNALPLGQRSARSHQPIVCRFGKRRGRSRILIAECSCVMRSASARAAGAASDESAQRFRRPWIDRGRRLIGELECILTTRVCDRVVAILLFLKSSPRLSRPLLAPRYPRSCFASNAPPSALAADLRLQRLSRRCRE